jgi:hypothetical protein
MELESKVAELENYIRQMKLKHRAAARAHYRKKFGVTPDLYKENRIISAGYFWRSKTSRDVFPTVEYFA